MNNLNLMANDDQSTGTAVQEPTLNIPEEVRTKFPEIVELIQRSQSMNTEERQYWIDVLPIMTNDQVSNLLGILENEKKQIDEAEQEYGKKIQKEGNKLIDKFDEFKYREKKQLIHEAEKEHEETEQEHEEALLREIEQMNH